MVVIKIVEKDKKVNKLIPCFDDSSDTELHHISNHKGAFHHSVCGQRGHKYSNNLNSHNGDHLPLDGELQ